MDIASIIDGAGVPVAELARRVGVSDGHLFDIKSGRRRLTVEIAGRLEVATGRRGIVDWVVQQRLQAA